MQIIFHLIFENRGGRVFGRCLEVPEAAGDGKKIAECKETLWTSISDHFKQQEIAARKNIPVDAIEVELLLK